MLVRRCRPALICSLAVLAALTGCAQSKLDTARAQRKIPAQLAAVYRPAAVGSMSCTPRKVALKPGGTFRCNTAIDGQPVSVQVVEDDDKGNVSFHLDKAVVVTQRASHELASNLAHQQRAGKVAVACPGPNARVLAVGQAFDCRVTFAGSVTPYRVFACDLRGTLKYLPAAAATDGSKACSGASG